MKKHNTIHHSSLVSRSIFTKVRIFWSIVFTLVAAQIYLAIQISTMGAELSVLEHSQTVIARENQELELSLVKKSSLSSIEQKAESNGYSYPKKMVYLKYDQNVAQAR